MPLGKSKQISKTVKKFRGHGMGSLRNEMTPKRNSQGRTKMMHPKAFQFMRMDRKKPKQGKS